MKKWKVLNSLKNKKVEADELIGLLLENRGIADKKDVEEFLHPKLENISIESVGIDRKELKKALERINSAIVKKEQVIVFGDYDVDGITGTAILWESLNEMGAKVLPYIPDRIEEGYGLSLAGIKNLESKIGDVKLIITVDNGIVANEAVDAVNKKGIDVIITDHHTPPVGGGQNLPDALAIVHTTKLCGAGVAYLLSQEFKSNGQKLKGVDSHLELAALGTIADLVPLTGANRTIVKYGLKKLAETTRPGLLALYEQAGILSKSKQELSIGTYEVGFMIAPRLNASGRIESAMDSLRLLCTKKFERARLLAEKLEQTNRDRQQLMKSAAEDAVLRVRNSESGIRNILIVAHEEYNEGIIGLVAGKLVTEFYRPSIVISKREKHSKGSVRSVEGFNIIEFLRKRPEFFLSLGGHPMAAGFSIETEKIASFIEYAEKMVEEMISEEVLTRSLNIDCEIELSEVSKEFFAVISKLEPFGMKNPEPVFATKGVIVEEVRVMGKEGKHLRIKIKDQRPKAKTDLNNSIECVGFGMGELASQIKQGDKIDVAYCVDENRWNGSVKMQLKVKDLGLN